MIGPTVPAHILSARPPTPEEESENEGPMPSAAIEPQIPPQVTAHPMPPPPDEDEDEDEDDYAPALPPDMLTSRDPAPSPSAQGGSTSKRVLGPAFPPSMAGQHQSFDEDDDDYGPSPLPAGLVVEEKDGVKEFLEREERRRKQIEEASKPQALKREEWMLVPPSSSDLLECKSALECTFSSVVQTSNVYDGFARSAAPARNSDNSLWTETPAERQQRIADEVAGKRRRVTDADAMSPDEEREMRKRRKQEEEVRRGVEEHTRKVRGSTLLDRHARAAPSEDKDEEGPPAIWDHTRDMALSGRLMDDKSREKFIRDARGLSDRFGSGKSGGFL
ncbi:uncharacterized protein FIBRA_00935 [Fibroporia radiculosa]|uniref:DUF3752 domain-containing protein n=1 Tax=Fibroporia radiculosa TaxID=599839 RepID=J4G0P6_9APHY|nr:uncharacterized protein FIBRA_00935 [Fibroporia radiculosa]CCL98928.1 predicted protein [Fibroporia radiculosa]